MAHTQKDFHVAGTTVVYVEWNGKQHAIATTNFRLPWHEDRFKEMEERDGNTRLFAAARETKRQRDALLAAMKHARMNLLGFESLDADGVRFKLRVVNNVIIKAIADCEADNG